MRPGWVKAAMGGNAACGSGAEGSEIVVWLSLLKIFLQECSIVLEN